MGVDYGGFKRKMEFRQLKGAKSDWAMVQYYVLDPYTHPLGVMHGHGMCVKMVRYLLCAKIS